ncbi:MAG TPA: tetratricopeptide repeat protein [Candidatus Omnitrophica bacterium]|nr:tetratricopeptide repeat protein [Candidatus Omnitrophota bacterium]
MRKRVKKFYNFQLSLLMIVAGLVCSINSSLNAATPQQYEQLQPLKEVRSLLDEGLEYLRLDKFDEARAKFEEALEIAPEAVRDDIKNLILRMDELRLRRIEERKKVVEKGEEEAKKIAELKEKIIVFEEQQREEEKQKLVQGYIKKGLAYYEKGEYEKGLLEFEKALSVAPDSEDAVIYIKKTKIAMEKEKERKRKEFYLDREEEIRQCWRNAKQYYRARRYDDAVRELKRLLAIDPTNKDAIEYMALAEEMKLVGEKIEEAERLEDMVIKGKKYYREGNYDKAIEVWKEVLKEREDYPGIDVLISQALFAKLKEREKVILEKEKTARKGKMLEIEEAYVPVSVEEGIVVGEEVVEVVDERQKAIEALKKKAVEQKVSIEFTSADLRSVILFLSRQTGINIMIDEAIFEEEMVAPVEVGEEGAAVPVAPRRVHEVTASLKNVSLLAALGAILRARDLDYQIYPEYIWISTRERIQNVVLEPLETRIFDLQFGVPIRRRFVKTVPFERERRERERRERDKNR